MHWYKDVPVLAKHLLVSLEQGQLWIRLGWAAEGTPPTPANWKQHRDQWSVGMHWDQNLRDCPTLNIAEHISVYFRIRKSVLIKRHKV